MPSKIFTIAASDNFTHSLVHGVWERFGNDPLTLSDIRIFLPTRRACRAVATAFLQLSDGKAMVLPKLIPLGEADADEETLIVQQMASDNPDDTVLNLRPAMPSMQRILLLTRQITMAYPDIPMAQAVSLAKDLASFIDQSVTAGIDYAALLDLVPEEYSQHWQKTLDFLTIVTHHWDDILDAYHCVDSAARRDSLLRVQASTWQQNPPTTPVIAAGVNGSIPAALELLAVIKNLDNGSIVLPALDTQMDEKSWNCIGDTHPQNALKTILDYLETDRTAVTDWNTTSITQHPEKVEREKLACELMRPAETSEQWQSLHNNETPINPKLATENIFTMECADENEEATAIALILRETLETPRKTAMLVTPDRKLARRVTQIMERWNVTINDSAGRALGLWPAGSFINLTLSFINNPSNAVTFLAMLKHPLCRCGHYSEQWLEKVSLFERHVLRGSRFKGDFQSYRKTLEYRATQAQEKGYDYPAEKLSDFLDCVEEHLSPLLGLLHNKSTSITVKQWIIAHIQTLENMAKTGDIAGSDRLWKNEDGDAASSGFAQLLEQHALAPECDCEAYAAIISQIILPQTIRPKTPAHPRVTILSPMETRLLTADTIILASLNEGHWPPESPNDPWMSRPMRATYGLPSTDRFIGLAAHDFINGFCANEVYLTRADRIDNAPTVKSRWLLRLETVLNQLSFQPHQLQNHRYMTLAQHIETVEDNECYSLATPAPCPAIEYRPKRLSFTDIEKWIKDPYSIYAKHVLRLKKLDELDGDTENADKGTLLHDIFEQFIRQTLKGEQATFEKLHEIAQKSFAQSLMDEASKETLWPIFLELSQWFIANHNKRLSTGTIPLAVECNAQWQVPDAPVPFTLFGRADRIDKMSADGTLDIIDYKTGSVPSKTDILSGYAPQLALEAMVADAGGFDKLDACTVDTISYWALKIKKTDEPNITTIDDVQTIISQTKERLNEMIRVYYNAKSPAAYLVTPDSDNALDYNDYEHLERTAEWGE